MEMFTSLAACKCVQRMYQNFSLGVFNSLQGNENQMISFFFSFLFFFFSKAGMFFLSAIMQLNNDECSRQKRNRERTTNRSGKQILRWKLKPKRKKGVREQGKACDRFKFAGKRI